MGRKWAKTSSKEEEPTLPKRRVLRYNKRNTKKQ